METLSLFNELADPKSALKAAIAADVVAAGGIKAAAKFIWPDSDKPLADEQRLRNAGLQGQKQLLDYFDIQQLKLAARLRSGASHIHAMESKALKADLHWVTAQEEAQQVTVNLVSSVQGLHTAIAQANDLLKRLSEVAKPA